MSEELYNSDDFCKLAEQYEELKKENDELTADKRDLERKVKALEADYIISNRELLILQVELARIAELEAENDRLQDAWFLDETICPDGSLRPTVSQLLSRIAELEAAQKEALSLLPELERGHYYCDDCWYSCPKAIDGCCDERQGDECNCGADNYNALLAKIIGLLTPEGA